ncbi:MAG: hypothetical protein SPJ60_10210 [Sodaliphilus sp.]|nr:hypothetical protein [Sodaliphilus sp.]
MGGREVSRPYRVCFSPKASGFYPWGDATALAGEGGVGDVVCLIQASASNHKPKGRFFWFVYAKGIPKEPSLWFVVRGSGLNQPHHITNADFSSEVGGIAKRIKTARLRRKNQTR